MLRVALDVDRDTTLGILKKTKITGSELAGIISADIPESKMSRMYKFLECDVQFNLPEEDRATTIARLIAELNPLKNIHTIIFENCHFTLDQTTLLISVSLQLNYDLQIVVNETSREENDPQDVKFLNTSSTFQQYGKWLRRFRNYWWKEAADDSDALMKNLIKEYQAFINKATLFVWSFHTGYTLASNAQSANKETSPSVSLWSKHETTGLILYQQLSQYLQKLNDKSRTDISDMRLTVINLMADLKDYFPYSRNDLRLTKDIYYMSLGAYKMTRYLAADLLGSSQKINDMPAIVENLAKAYQSVSQRVQKYQCLDKEIMRLYMAHTALMFKLVDYLVQNDVPINSGLVVSFHSKEGQARFYELAVLANVKASSSACAYDIGIGLCLFIKRQIFPICETDKTLRSVRVQGALTRLDQIMRANTDSIAAKLIYIHVANEMLLHFEAGMTGANNFSRKDIEYIADLHRKLSGLHQKWGELIRASNIKDYQASHYAYQGWCATNLMRVFDATFLYRREEKIIKKQVGDDAPIPRSLLFGLFTKLRNQLPDPLQLCADYLDRLHASDVARVGTVLEICTTVSHQTLAHTSAHRKYFCLLIANLGEWMSMCVNEVGQIVERQSEIDYINESDYQILQDICNYGDKVAAALLYKNNLDALTEIYSDVGVTMMHIHMFQITSRTPSLRAALSELRALALQRIADEAAEAEARKKSVSKSMKVIQKEHHKVKLNKNLQMKKVKAESLESKPATKASAKTPVNGVVKVDTKGAKTSTSSVASTSATMFAVPAERQKVSSFLNTIDQLMRRKNFKQAINSAEDYLKAIKSEGQEISLQDYPHIVALYYRLYECVTGARSKSDANTEMQARKYLELAQPYLKDVFAFCLVEEGSELHALLSMMQDEMKKFDIHVAATVDIKLSAQPVPPESIMVEPITIQYDDDVKSFIALLLAHIKSSRIYTFGSYNTAQVYKAYHADGFEPHVSDVDFLVCIDDKDAAVEAIKKSFPQFYHSSKLRNLELFRGQFGRWKIDLVISLETVERFIEKSDLTIKSIVADDQGRIVGSGKTMGVDMKTKTVQFMPGFAERYAEYQDPSLLMNYIRAFIVYPGFKPIESHLQFVRDHVRDLLTLPNATAVFQKHFQSGNAKLAFKMWYENGVFDLLLPDVAKTLPMNEQVYLNFCEQFDRSYQHYGRYDSASGEYVIACLLRLAANCFVGDKCDGRHAIWYDSSVFAGSDWLTKKERASVRAIVCHEKTCQPLVETKSNTQSAGLLFSVASTASTSSTLATQSTSVQKINANRRGNGH